MNTAPAPTLADSAAELITLCDGLIARTGAVRALCEKAGAPMTVKEAHRVIDRLLDTRHKLTLIKQDQPR